MQSARTTLIAELKAATPEAEVKAAKVKFRTAEHTAEANYRSAKKSARATYSAAVAAAVAQLKTALGL